MSNDYSHLIAEVRRERQTEERIRQNDAADTVAEIHALEDKIEALEAENRLYSESLANYAQENARLREEVTVYAEGYKGACYACEPVGELNMKLRAENERQRGLLSWAAGRLLDAGDVEGHERVLAALEGK